MEIFQNVKKDTWNSVNIISYHASMVYALGIASKYHVTRQIH